MTEPSAAATTEERPATWHDTLFRWRGWCIAVVAVATFVLVLATRGLRWPLLRETLLAAPLVFGGALWRIWARSFLTRGTDTRRVHARRLVIGGPYRRHRNPLYVGNMLMATGLALAFAGPLAAAAILVALFVLYGAIVRSEESILRATFQERFDRFTAAVPRWFPRFAAAPADADMPSPEFGLAFRNEAKRFAGAAGAWGVAVGLALLAI